MTKDRKLPSLTKERSLPPLLPLEYCRIDRAARMLECGVEDIVHWGAVGAVKLCVQVDLMPCCLEAVIRLTDDPFGKPADSLELTDVEGSRLEAIINLLEQPLKLGGYSIFHPNHMREGDGNGLVQFPNGSVGFRHHGRASGLWEVSSQIAADMEKYGVWQQHGRFTRSLMLRPVNLERDSVLAQLSIYDDRESLEASELWILRLDLEKLHHSMATGEPLINIYNNAELAQRAQDEDTRQIVKPATGEGSMLSALGTMAVLLYKAKGQNLKWGGNLNQSRMAELIKDMAVELGLPDSGLDNIRKDIGRAIRQEPFKSYFQNEVDTQKQLAQK